MFIVFFILHVEIFAEKCLPVSFFLYKQRQDESEIHSLWAIPDVPIFGELSVLSLFQ